MQEGAEACIEAVYRHGGEARGKVIAVHDDPDGAAFLERLRRLQEDHPDLIVLANEARVGLVASCNRGLLLRERDAVLLGVGTALASGWLEALLEVLDSSDRIASVAASGSCVLFRHWVLNAIGCFDSRIESLAGARAEWSERAMRMGLRHLHAHHAVVAASAAREPLRVCVGLRSSSRDGDDLMRRLRALNGLEVERLEDGLPLERFQVLYLPELIPDARHLARVLDSPCRLVLGAGDPRKSGAEPRALLFAAAQSAQAVLAGSEADRTALVAELLLDPALVEVVALSDARALADVFRRAADRPSEETLRQRRLLANFARWPPRPAT